MDVFQRMKLRQKHSLNLEEDLLECVGCSTPEDSVEWPCDVIKVLDAWEYDLYHTVNVSNVQITLIEPKEETLDRQGCNDRAGSSQDFSRGTFWYDAI
jgi:hypothetical protein